MSSCLEEKVPSNLIKVKHEGVRQQCPQCSQTVVFGTLKRHINTFHTKLTYQCQSCERDFRSKYGLSSHVNEKHKAVPIEYTCEICGEGNLFSSQARVTHKRNKHPKEVEEKKHNNKRNGEILEVPKELLLLGFGPRRISASGIKKNQ